MDILTLELGKYRVQGFVSFCRIKSRLNSGVCGIYGYLSAKRGTRSENVSKYFFDLSDPHHRISFALRLVSLVAVGWLPAARGTSECLSQITKRDGLSSKL